MERFPQVKKVDTQALELEVLRQWKESRTFERSVGERPDAPPFVFYEGPPTANGRPGIHHVMARTIKDVFCRYKTLKGFRVVRKAGWDTHGLPVEIEVEKALGLKSRADIEAYGIARYNAACRESVLKYTSLWNDLTERMGYWVDLDDPYVTFTNEYMESVWWLLRQMYDKGLLYQGHKIQWYSPSSGTVLSSHEVSLGYKEIQDPSVYVRFPLRDDPAVSFLAWTTTPWTLPSNTLLAVGPNVPYVKVRAGEHVYILAEARLSVLKEDVEVLERYTGKDLVGMRYIPPFDAFLLQHGEEAAWRVVSAGFVTTEDGTGIVHIAPAFGADDFTTGQAEGVPVLNPVLPDGTFDDTLPLVQGKFFKDADRTLIRALREKGVLYREDSYLHNYPHDWRKGTPLMQYPVESWFVRTTARKDQLIALNGTIGWQPSGIGEGRFGEWLRGNVDWALSRRRYWGTPLPIWKSDAPGSDYVECIGSMAELFDKVGGAWPQEAINPDTGNVDLHRPYVDALTWPSPDGGTMRRVPDLIDVWFDSGAMPFAQWHYPFEHQERFAQSFPADFIAEGVDQTRGWFYTLHAIATLVQDSVAYKNVVVNGLVLDEKGEKMSKSKGNAVDPFSTIETYGADVVRWSMMSSSPPWENLRFSERALQDTRRKFFGTIENTYAFFATYAAIDAPDFSLPPIPLAERAELDRWVLARLQETIQQVDEALEAYHPTRAARSVERFVEDLSNWYIRRSRRRFWKSEDAQDKLAAYQTVHECLTHLAVLMSPIAPFYSEWLYQALTRSVPGQWADSVHLAAFPKADADKRDGALVHAMDLARTISSLVLGLRHEAGLNVRQPLPRVIVVIAPGVEEVVLRSIEHIVRDEVNIKAMEYVSAASAFVQRKVAPNFRVLGKRMGPRMKAAQARILAMSDAEIDALVREGAVALDVDGAPETFTLDEISVTSQGVAGWLVAQEGPVAVALDTALTPELIAEGLVRETVNRVQNARKAQDLDVTDRIHVSFVATPTLEAAIHLHAAYIRNETLALTFHAVSALPDAEEHVMGQETLRFHLSRA